MRKRILAAGIVMLCCALLPAMGWADTMFSVNIDTSSLLGNAQSPFFLEFQMLDGSGADPADANNTVAISNFNFGGGAAAGTPELSGGASGDLSTTVSLTDSAFFNDFIQEFTPGTTLDFDVSLTTHADAGDVPDSFAVAILYKDSNGYVNLPTSDPMGTAFVAVSITPHASIELYDNQTPGVPTPTITPTAVVPLPAAWMTTLSGLAALLVFSRRRQPVP